MIGRIIEACARSPWLTVMFVAALTVWGLVSLRQTPLDAVPDLSDTQVIVLTEWPGRSPDLVEDQLTYPISASLLAAPNVQYVRGQSFFGTSFVSVIFEDGTDLYWARSRVLEYLNAVREDLPQGVNPVLGPDATGVGWVFMYALVDDSGQHDLAELRSLQDWNLRYALESVDGVAEVATLGGVVRQYQVEVDPNRLRALDVPLERVISAVRGANEDAGGRVLEIAGHEHMIRGRGYITELADLRAIPLGVSEAGVPILLEQVAEVSFGPDMQRGIAELDGEGEVVGGIVVMRYGENALATIERVKERLAEIELPPGVRVVTTYDRSELIEDAVETLRGTLIEEMLVVSLIIFLFLLHVRSALVAIITLPIAVLLAFIPMLHQGLTANIMSLGGIAVAMGAMVDASIIMIENVHKRLEERPDDDRVDVIVDAMKQVGPSVFFSLLVMTVSFLPVFTLEATEGRLFKPLAFTKTYSMGFAALLAVTLTPALAALLIRGRIRREDDNPLNRWLIAAYEPVVRFVVDHRRKVMGAATLLVSLTVPVLLFGFQWEFMPPLNEGTILYMPSAPPGMSVTEAANVLQDMDRELMKIPEVKRVFGKMGRADTATDPAPLGMAETTILLEPKENWRPGLTWDDLVKELDEKLQYPGMPNIWWMPIQTRTEMLATGVRSPLAVQVFGDDLRTIEEAAVAIERALLEVDGTRSAIAERASGGFFIDVVVDRLAAARHGLGVSQVNDVVRTAIGGTQVSEVVKGRERYPINVRYARELRDDPDALSRVLVPTPTGAQVPLSQVAEIAFVSGPDMFRSEDGKLVGFVFVDPGEIAIGEYVKLGRQAMSELTLPPGVRTEWVGQYKYLERAWSKLLLVLPLTLFLVVMLLYLNTRSGVETAIVLTAVPFSLVGAVWLLWGLDYNLSVAVAVGMIALAGLDAETGVVMLLYLTMAHDKAVKAGMTHFDELREAIVDGAARRIRPKLMTVATTFIGLSPILWSTGTGADVMKRIAAPMIGGLVTSFLLELTVYPAIFAWWKEKGLAVGERDGVAPE